MSWYKVQALSDGKASIEIEGEIGWNVDSFSFGRELKSLGNVSEIDVYLNSPGGDINDGMAIYDMLRRSPAAVNMYITSLAASMGSVIAQSGDTVHIAETGMMMIHNPWAMAYGEADDFLSTADMLKKYKKNMIAAYKSRGKLSLSDDELIEAMDKTTWYTPEEAVSAGLVDSVGKNIDAKGKALKAVAMFDLKKLENIPDSYKEKVKALQDSPDGGSSAATIPTESNSMSKEGNKTFSQAELDAAVSAAVDTALKTERENQEASDPAEQTDSVHARYEALLAHENGANVNAVQRLAKSPMPIADALAFMDDVSAPTAAKKEDAPVITDEMKQAASAAAVQAVMAMRADASDTKVVEAGNSSDDKDDEDKVSAAQARANERRAK